MPLFDLRGALGNMNKTYTIRVKCRNCGHIGELRIPKGITVTEHVTSGDGKCTNCGCGELNAQSHSIPKTAKVKPLPQQGGAW